jgi:hypothetical protein
VSGPRLSSRVAALALICVATSDTPAQDGPAGRGVPPGSSLRSYQSTDVGLDPIQYGTTGTINERLARFERALPALERSREKLITVHGALGYVDRGVDVTLDLAGDRDPRLRVAAAGKKAIDAPFRVLLNKSLMETLQAGIEEDLASSLTELVTTVLNPDELANLSDKTVHEAFLLYDPIERLQNYRTDGLTDAEEKSLAQLTDRAEVALSKRTMTEVMALGTRIGSLESKVEKLKDVAARQERLESTVTNIAGRLKGVETAVVAVVKAQQQFDERLGGVEKRLGQQGQDLDFLKTFALRRLTPDERKAAIKQCIPDNECILGKLNATEIADYKAKAEFDEAIDAVHAAASVYGQGLISMADNLGLGGKVPSSVRKGVAAVGPLLGLASGSPTQMFESVVALTGIFGKGSQDPGAARHQQLLGELDRQFGQVNLKLDKLLEGQKALLEGQKEIMTRLDGLSIEIKKSEASILDAIEFGLDLQQASMTDGVNACISGVPQDYFAASEYWLDWVERLPSKYGAVRSARRALLPPRFTQAFRGCHGALDEILSFDAAIDRIHPWLRVEAGDGLTSAATWIRDSYIPAFVRWDHHATLPSNRRPESQTAPFPPQSGAEGFLLLHERPAHDILAAARSWRNGGMSTDLASQEQAARVRGGLRDPVSRRRVFDVGIAVGLQHPAWASWDARDEWYDRPGHAPDLNRVDPAFGWDWTIHAMGILEVSLSQQSLLSGWGPAPFVALDLLDPTTSAEAVKTLGQIPSWKPAVAAFTLLELAHRSVKASGRKEREVHALVDIAVRGGRHRALLSILGNPEGIDLDCVRSAEGPSCTLVVSSPDGRANLPLPPVTNWGNVVPSHDPVFADGLELYFALMGEASTYVGVVSGEDDEASVADAFAR